MKSKLLVFVFFLVIGCCKEKLPVSDDPIMGTWNIVRVDSVFSGYPLLEDYTRFLGTTNYTGSLSFFPDSTGVLSGSITRISEGEKSFLWGYDTTVLPVIKLYMAFISGWTRAYVDTITADSLSIFIKDFTFAPNPYGGHYYYHYFLTKK